MSSVWKYNVSWTDQFYADNKDIIHSNYDKKPNSNPWNCDLHTHGTDPNDYQHDGLEDIDFSFLQKEYTKISKKILNENNILVDCSVDSVWYNFYLKGQFQEPHNHEGHFVGVHFIKYLKEHPTLSFEDSGIIVPKISQGDLIVFPANLVHYVERNEVNEPRLTIAFGINLC